MMLHPQPRKYTTIHRDSVRHSKSLVFTGRNINRISAENKKYDYKPLENIFYAVNEKHYLRHNIEIRNLINTFEQCKELKNDKKCEDLNSRMGIYLDKYYYFK